MSDDIRERMWKELAASPYLMVSLTEAHDHAIPLTAQLDKDANGKFWFYLGRDNRLAKGGAAMAQFSAKSHDLFACIAGRLVEETDQSVIDAHWSNAVEAWFEGGRNDPNLLMLRFELDDAEIWAADASIKGLFKMLTGSTIKPGEMGKHAEVAL